MCKPQQLCHYADPRKTLSEKCTKVTKRNFCISKKILHVAKRDKMKSHISRNLMIYITETLGINTNILNFKG